MIFHSVSLYPPNIINFIRCSGPNHRGTHMALSMVWIFELALLHCSLTLYCSYGWMSWRVMVEKRLKESTHTILVKELFRPPVHQTYAHAICSRRRCVCVCVCVCVCARVHGYVRLLVWLCEWNTIYCQLGMLYIAQTCPLTMDGEVLKELKLDKNHLYHHSNPIHSSQAWHPPDFPQQRLQTYAPLNLPH